MLRHVIQRIKPFVVVDASIASGTSAKTDTAAAVADDSGSSVERQRVRESPAA
jgi:hypothetical protein